MTQNDQRNCPTSEGGTSDPLLELAASGTSTMCERRLISSTCLAMHACTWLSSTVHAGSAITDALRSQASAFFGAGLPPLPPLRHSKPPRLVEKIDRRRSRWKRFLRSDPPRRSDPRRSDWFQAVSVGSRRRKTVGWGPKAKAVRCLLWSTVKRFWRSTDFESFIEPTVRWYPGSVA